MSVFVSEGGLVPVEAKAWPFPSSGMTRQTIGPSSGRIPLLVNGRSSTYEAMVRSQPWVFAAVGRLAYGMMRVSLKVYDGEESDDRKRVRAHDLPRLLSKPQKRMRRAHLMLKLGGDLFTHGNAIQIKYRDERLGTPTELWPVPWRMVQKVEDERGIVGYNVHIGGRVIPVDLDDVVHYELLGGISPLEPLRRTLALEDATMEWQGQNVANGITPRGAFVLPKDTVVKDDNDLKKLRAELEKLYVGPTNAGRFGLFWGGLEWQQMGHSAVDSQLVEQRKLSREEVAAAYDVPPPFLGILDKATYSNITELRRSHYVDGLGPKLELVQETIQAQLVDLEPAWDGLFVEFDLASLIAPDSEAMARMLLMLQQSATTTGNERRKIMNLPQKTPAEDPYADRILYPVNMSATPGAVPGDGTDPDPAGGTQATLSDGLTLEAVRGGKPAAADEEEG